MSEPCKTSAEKRGAGHGPGRERRVEARDAQAGVRRRRAVALHVDQPRRRCVGLHVQRRLPNKEKKRGEERDEQHKAQPDLDG